MPSITIPFSDWELIGPENDPTSRLLATLTLNGQSMHVDAVAVREVRSGKPFAYTTLVAVNAECAEMLSVMEAVDREMLYQTTRIGCRDYVVVASPFGR